MGNVSGKFEGESSGDKHGEGYEQEGMEFAAQGGSAHGGYHVQAAYPETEPMVHSPPHSPSRYLHHPLLFTPQVPIVPLPRSGEMMHVQNYALARETMAFGDVLSEKLRAVMITWSNNGKQVAVTGSWDNWNKREPMQRSGKDFIITKMLPSGVYHYRFIVDEQVRYAPDLPWECSDSGSIYNVLDVQEFTPEASESLSEFESPPSPDSTYNNDSLNNEDFSKLPPDMPPQLQLTLLNHQSSAAANHQSLPRPPHAGLNHLYIQNNGGQPVALGSTHRFLQKYVTVKLYKPSQKKK